MLSPPDTSTNGNLLQSLTAGGWTITADGTAAEKTFRFRSFSAAFGFMARVALAAEAMNHHPEWSNVYGRVNVRLTTHDWGRITELDGQLATIMDRIAATSELK